MSFSTLLLRVSFTMLSAATLTYCLLLTILTILLPIISRMNQGSIRKLASRLNDGVVVDCASLIRPLSVPSFSSRSRLYGELLGPGIIPILMICEYDIESRGFRY